MLNAVINIWKKMEWSYLNVFLAALKLQEDKKYNRQATLDVWTCGNKRE